MTLDQLIINLLRKRKVCRKNPRVAEILTGVATYPVLGMTPGRVQEHFGEESRVDPKILTYSSIGYSFVYESGKLAAGFLIAEIPVLGLPGFILGSLLKGYALYSLTQAGIRTIYTATTKKPIGLFVLELMDRTNDVVFPDVREHDNSEKFYFRSVWKNDLDQRYEEKKGVINWIKHHVENLTIMNDYR